jgi:hypothetical protein
MGYVPADAQWYLAEIVLEMTIEGDTRNVVHTNALLVRADSPEQAYAAAIQLGRDAEISYDNPSGGLATTAFIGLRRLDVIYGQLEHGAEIYFYENIGVPRVDLEAMVKPKDALSVFMPREEPSDDRPDYASGEVMREVHELMDGADPEEGRRASS